MAVAKPITIPCAQKAPVPLRAIHAEWRAAKDAYNALPDDCDAATDAAAFRRMTAASDSAMQWKPLTVQDMALKIIIADDGGDMKVNVDQEALAKTAYEIAGIDQKTGKTLRVATDAPLTMSSREIAELCSKRHDNVMRDIKTMLDSLQKDALRFEGIYSDAYGREKPSYNLPKDLTLTLVAGYDVVLRKRIIDRWLELEGQQLQQFGYQPVDLSGVMASLAELRDLVMTLTKRPEPVAKPVDPWAHLPTATVQFRSRRVAAPKVRRDIPQPLRGGGAPMPDFAAAKEGQSFHVKTAEEYNRIASNFKYWKKKNDAQLKISRRAVGADDPDGPGFRIWYVNDDPWL